MKSGRLVLLGLAFFCSRALGAASSESDEYTRYELLEHPGEGELIRALGGYPDAVRAAAQRRQLHRVPRHLETVATACERVEAHCRVLPMGDEPITELYRARLALCLAARQVLANGLGLLGVSAPERM